MPSETDAEFIALQEALAGRYSLQRELGRGGMGIVYLAHEVALDRPVALKLLPPRLAAAPALVERFMREARTAARLSQPNIVPIHAVDQVGNFVFFTMGYVEGESLGAAIRRRGALPATDGARILREVAWALAYAHAQGVVHRDVKPDNILLEGANGRALVTDFGIAQVGAAPGPTGCGEVIGTAEFMSPEQASGSAVDERSDIRNAWNPTQRRAARLWKQRARLRSWPLAGDRAARPCSISRPSAIVAVHRYHNRGARGAVRPEGTRSARCTRRDRASAHPARRARSASGAGADPGGWPASA